MATGKANDPLGSSAEAVPLLRAAQRRYPSDFWLSLDLGNALDKASRSEEALGFFQAAVALRPDVPAAHTNLGSALSRKGDVDGAIYEYRKAIELDPRHVPGHSNLGLALTDEGQLDEAIREYRIAIDLDPKFAIAHIGLGEALRAKQDLESAEAAFRQAIALDPRRPHAHGALGQALLDQGRLVDARIALRRCLELLPERDPLRQGVSELLDYCDRLAGLEERLPALLSGQTSPADAMSYVPALPQPAEGPLSGQTVTTDAAKRIALGQLLQYKRLHAAAARAYADAFVADPQLADNGYQPHRYLAARNAVLAAAGQGEDAKCLPDKPRLGLRRQALIWLRDELALNAKLAERTEPAARQIVAKRMHHWQRDAALVYVRDPQALDRLPDDERQPWQQLWQDVATLLKKVEQKP